MSTRLDDLIQLGETNSSEDIGNCFPHHCLNPRAYHKYQNEAIDHAIELISGTLTRIRGYEVNYESARKILDHGEKSEFDSFMVIDDHESNPYRNFRSFAIGYWAGYCGYTCPDRTGCFRSKLFSGKPNYSKDLKEQPERLMRVFNDLCHDIGLGLIDSQESDAILRFLEENKYIRSEEAVHDIGLENAEYDFKKRINLFFLDMGFKLGRSPEYAACYRQSRLGEEWMQEVHGEFALSD